MCHSVSPCAQPCPCHSHWRWWGATSRPAPEKPFSGCWRHSCGNTELQSRQEIRQEEAQGQRPRSRRHRSNLFMICLPMGVEPVKPSLRMSGWSDRRCPTMPPAGGDKWCVRVCFSTELFAVAESYGRALRWPLRDDFLVLEVSLFLLWKFNQHQMLHGYEVMYLTCILFSCVMIPFVKWWWVRRPSNLSRKFK